MRIPRFSPRFLLFLTITGIAWTIFSKDSASEPLWAAPSRDLEKLATRPFGGDSEPPLIEKPRDSLADDANKANEVTGGEIGTGVDKPTKDLEWDRDAIDLTRKVPVLEPDPDWKPPPNESLPYKIPNGEEKLVKCRAEYDGPCHGYPPLLESESKLPRTFAAGALQRFTIRAPGIFTASLVSYPDSVDPTTDYTSAPLYIVPIHLIPDPERAKRAYLNNEHVEIGTWYAAFIAPTPGSYILVVRLRQQSSIITDPLECTPLAAYTDPEMELATAPVDYSDEDSGSAYARGLKEKCGWGWKREHWYDLMKDDPGRPENVPWAKSKVFEVEVRVGEPVEAKESIPVPKTTGGRLTPNLEALFRFVYQPPISTTSASIAGDLRLFSLGTYHPPPSDLASETTPKPLPGNPWTHPSTESCPFVYERHAIAANCSTRKGDLYYLPLLAENRTSWLVPRERMLRCIREERFKIVGDSLAGLFSSALGCTCLIYGGRCKWEVMDSRGQKGQIFPLQFFSSLEGTEQEHELFDFLKGGNGSGVQLWQLGAWPTAYTNSSAWLSGFGKLLAEMEADLDQGSKWDSWRAKRDRHRVAEKKREKEEIEEMADAERLKAKGELGHVMRVKKEQYLRFLARVPFSKGDVPDVPRRFIVNTGTPFQTLLEPLSYLKTPGFQTLGRSIKFNHALLGAFSEHRRKGGGVEMMDTFRLLEQRMDARTDNAHYCPSVNWEVAMVLWHGLCRDVE